MGWQHGASGYHNHGCKCDVCRAGWAAYCREYAKRRKARGERRTNRGWTSEPAKPRLKPPGGDLPWPPVSE